MGKIDDFTKKVQGNLVVWYLATLVVGFTAGASALGFLIGGKALHISTGAEWTDIQRRLDEGKESTLALLKTAPNSAFPALLASETSPAKIARLDLNPVFQKNGAFDPYCSPGPCFFGLYDSPERNPVAGIFTFDLDVKARVRSAVLHIDGTEDPTKGRKDHYCIQISVDGKSDEPYTFKTIQHHPDVGNKPAPLTAWGPEDIYINPKLFQNRTQNRLTIRLSCTTKSSDDWLVVKSAYLSVAYYE